MARCQKPIVLENSVTKKGQMIPCGKCPACLSNKVSNWSFRLMQEDKVSDSSYFITLTYEPHSTCITKNGFMDLSKRDFQLFFKRFRVAHDRLRVSGKPLKYFAVGEYGGKFARPHFHFLVFNAELSVLVGDTVASHVDAGRLQLDGKRPFRTDLWPKGHITIGKVSAASVGYTMKYISKPSRIPMHRNDDRIPEFSMMSKGLGISYLTKAMVAWHKADLENRQYVNLLDGKKATLPRYYKKKMLTEQEALCLAEFNYRKSLEPVKYENTARERSEALYAGQNNLSISHFKNQKL